jgi:hypothetical protein
MVSKLSICLILLFSFWAKAEPLLGFYDNESQTNTPLREAWLNKPVMLMWNGGSPEFFGTTAPHWHMQPMVDWLKARPGRQIAYSLGMFRVSSPSSNKQTLAACAAGSYDTDFINVARAFQQYGITNNIFRIGWEFTGNWFSWRSAGQEANYAACYRRIVTVLRNTVPSNHWTFDWNPIAGTSAAILAKTYPGDAYVDYVSADIYDTSRYTLVAYPYPASCDAACRLTHQKANWNYINGQMNDLRNFGISHGKKFAVPEWGVWSEAGVTSSTPGGGDDPYFIQQFYNYINNPANNVAYTVYFEANASDGHHSLCCSPSQSEFPLSSALFQKLFGRSTKFVSSSLTLASVSRGGTETVTVTIASSVAYPNGKLSLAIRDSEKGTTAFSSVTLVNVKAVSNNVFKATFKIPLTQATGSYFITLGLYDGGPDGTAYKSLLYVNKIGVMQVTN